MRKTLLTSAAVLGFALALPAFAQTATDPNPANPSAVKDGTPAAGTGSGAAPGVDPAASGKTGATLGNQAPSQGPGPLGQQDNPGPSNGQSSESSMGAPAASTGSSGMNNPSAGPQTESAPSDQGSASETPARPRHRSMSSASGMGSGSGHWAHQPGTGESGPASSQASNIDSADTRGVIAPHLPQPMVGANAGPDGYLRAADRALAAHKTGAAQQALEMAETRLLDRSTAPDAASQPDQNPRIAAVSAARKALASKDWQGARRSIQEAMNGSGEGGMASEGGMSSGSGMSSSSGMASGASSGQMQNGMGSTGTGGTQGVANGNPGATPAPMDPTGSNPTNGAAGTTNPGPATAPNPMAPANGAK